jgi:hypothetical protein
MIVENDTGVNRNGAKSSSKGPGPGNLEREEKGETEGVFTAPLWRVRGTRNQIKSAI